MSARRPFQPSRQAIESRLPLADQRALVGPIKYLGDKNLKVNRGDHVENNMNTNVWLTGLPPETTYQSFLASIRGIGKVRALVIQPSDCQHSAAAAALTFFRRTDAEKFFERACMGQVTMGGKIPIVGWNRNKTEDMDEGFRSRVLLIAGDLDIVNGDYLDTFFAHYFVYQLDEIIDHGPLADSQGKLIGRLEYRFGSWRSQAEAGWMALKDIHGEKVCVEYGLDPCE